MNALITYVLAVSLLGLLAHLRSRSAHDALRARYGAFAISIGALLVAMAPSHGVTGVIEAGLVATLAICTWTDASSGYIYDVVLLAAALFVGLAAIVSGHALSSLEAAAVASALGVVVYGLSRGRGLGLGDVKLFAFTGAALGSVPLAIEAFGGSFVLGACVLVPALVLKRVERRQKIAFAPFIAIAAAAVLHYGVALL